MSVTQDKPQTDLDDVFGRYPNARREDLIPLLQDVQERMGFLSRQSVIEIARHLGLPASKVFGVATFYNQFRFQAAGRFHIQVCRGTACHVKGSLGVLEALKKELRIDINQTTRDGLFSLEVVACIGACGLAPAITVNGEVHARVTPEDVKALLGEYRKRAVAEEQ
jgi:NADH-quinone oxidoreductase subunit E